MKMKVITFGLFITFLSTHAAAEGVAIGEVKYVVGEAKVGDNELKVGSKVYSGDLLVTEKASIVRLLMTNGVATQIAPNTKMRIVQEDGKSMRVTLTVGAILSRIKKTAEVLTTPKYSVNTKHAAMGVRGTTFFVKLAKGESTFLCVCDGSVDVKRGVSSMELTSSNHDHVKHISSVGMDVAPDMGKDHSDKDIAALEKLLK